MSDIEEDNFPNIETDTNVEFTGKEAIELLSNINRLVDLLQKSTEDVEKSKAIVENYKKFYIPNITIAYEAAEKGDLELLESARGNGCPIDYCTVGFAAKNGHFDCVKYMISEAGIELHSDMCLDSVRGNQIEILKYLHKKGCECTEECVESAISFGFYDILVYLDENGCPWPSHFYPLTNVLEDAEKIKCLKYSIEKGKVKISKPIHIWTKDDNERYQNLLVNA